MKSREGVVYIQFEERKTRMSVLDWVVILVAVPIITVALNQTYMYFSVRTASLQPKEESTGVKVKLVFVGLMTVLFMSALDQQCLVLPYRQSSVTFTASI